MFARVIAWDIECRAVDRKRAEAVVSDCAQFIVAIIGLPIILLCFLITLCDVLASVKG